VSPSVEPPETSRQTSGLYAEAGVNANAEEHGMTGLLDSINQTFAFRSGVGRPLLPIGYFANVLDLGRGEGLAISTDGVGTKLLVAELVNRYDTVGIDCVAMNVNDIICVGAEPISLVDYVAVQVLRPDVLTALGKGLAEGARQARVSIPGGEIAQVREMVRGVRDDEGIDLVGSCVGVVPVNRIIVGENVAEGDVVVGLASSGIHSNGLTLARRVLFQQAGLAPADDVPELGRSVGEELLVPTRIYVEPILEMLQRLSVKSLAHITSDGLLNLLRIRSGVGFRIDNLPEPPAIFRLIQRLGGLPDGEMYTVFNMGIGFCVVVAPDQADAAIDIAQRRGVDAYRLGTAVAEPARTVELVPLGLVSQDGEFVTRG